MTGHGDNPSARRWLSCDHVWLDDHMGHDVLVGLDDDGIITEVIESQPTNSPREHASSSDQRGVKSTTGARGTGTVERVSGVVLPGLVNAHSHAFHRVLRGRTQPVGPAGDDTFWRWRDRMYAVAARLNPDSMFAVARATYGEMAQAGITSVGEFHYLHHGPDGVAYDDPNAMGHAVMAAAAEVGIRMTLLDTIYLTSAVGATLDQPDLGPVQRRFSDGDHDRWAQRVADLGNTPTCRIGVAIHSVRAVPPSAMTEVATFANRHDSPIRTLHAHVAEQPAEVAAAMAVHGCSPTQLLATAGALTDRFTAVHGVWLDRTAITLLAAAGATVCVCPTTERDLADGIVDGAALAAAGVRLALGSDQHGIIDLLEEARAMELDQRLATGVRGHHDASALLAAATTGGATSLGWPELGRIAIGAPADLAVVTTDTVRLAGVPTEDLAAAVVHAATADDVSATMVAGRWIVRDGHHLQRDVVADLDAAATLVDRP